VLSVSRSTARPQQDGQAPIAESSPLLGQRPEPLTERCGGIAPVAVILLLGLSKSGLPKAAPG
jgi:hypothetical protein